MWNICDHSISPDQHSLLHTHIHSGEFSAQLQLSLVLEILHSLCSYVCICHYKKYASMVNEITIITSNNLPKWHSLDTNTCVGTSATVLVYQHWHICLTSVYCVSITKEIIYTILNLEINDILVLFILKR